ncbi:MAG: hypothetical protein JXL80_10595 [Planctomycetes bacterium]|nr:hypothetical protein [Planctomycetota bacterium]
MTSVRYVTDGTYDLSTVARKLESRGVVYEQEPGRLRLVPDDPTYPETFLGSDGVVEIRLDPSAEQRVEEFLKDLSSWLGLGLTPVRSR